MKRNETCFVVSLLINLASICERNSKDGSLKTTSKVTNIICPFKTSGKERKDKNQRTNWLRKFL